MPLMFEKWAKLLWKWPNKIIHKYTQNIKMHTNTGQYLQIHNNTDTTFKFTTS